MRRRSHRRGPVSRPSVAKSPDLAVLWVRGRSWPPPSGCGKFLGGLGKVTHASEAFRMRASGEASHRDYSILGPFTLRISLLRKQDMRTRRRKSPSRACIPFGTTTPQALFKTDGCASSPCPECHPLACGPLKGRAMAPQRIGSLQAGNSRPCDTQVRARPFFKRRPAKPPSKSLANPRSRS